MAAIKCLSCERYSPLGCDLEHGAYYKFKDCILGRRSYWVRKYEKPEESEVKAAEMPAEGSNK